MKLDPSLVSELRSKLAIGSVMVVGTNGKTSVNNLVANGLEAAGYSVICNRKGANMKPGIATTLLQSAPAQWGVFESDELWLAKSLPDLQPRYVLLLNLFRDQLDRCGEIARIQDCIADVLKAHPETTLIYNADDPQCAQVAAEIPNKTLAFGVGEDLGLPQNTVVDATMCQRCEGMLSYDYRTYGQLGSYHCDQCDFQRPPLDYEARAVHFDAQGASWMVHRKRTGESWRLSVSQPSPYLVYNMLAASALLTELGVSPRVQQRTINQFNPQNGRLQHYDLEGRQLLLNLAKNPTGFNQNLKIVEADDQPKAVAFFINDKTADGHDISWIWDIDFEELAGAHSMVVFAGGDRAHDVAVRLKYAGIRSTIVESVNDALAQSDSLPMYVIANYTALPPVKAALDQLVANHSVPPQKSLAPDATPPSYRLPSVAKSSIHMLKDDDSSVQNSEAPESVTEANSISDGSLTPPSLKIVHMLPDLLNLYGDGGNVRILSQRLRWRGLPVEVQTVRYGEPVDFSTADLVFMGGGPDREQKLASEQLMALKEDLQAYVESDGVLLAICGGYQILGRQWLLGDDLVEGLSIIAMETRRPGTSADRLIDNMVLQSPLATRPVVGYENHAGRTYLDDGVQPFGTIVAGCGHGNNDETNVGACDGVLYKNVIGTYSHGPLLSKNPEIADELIQRARQRQWARVGKSAPPLELLDDSVEIAANNEMLSRLT